MKNLAFILLLCSLKVFGQPTPPTLITHIPNIYFGNEKLGIDEKHSSYYSEKEKTTYVFLKKNGKVFYDSFYISNSKKTPSYSFIYESDTLKINFVLSSSLTIRPNSSKTLTINNLCFHRGTTINLKLESFKLEDVLCNCFYRKEEEH